MKQLIIYKGYIFVDYIIEYVLLANICAYKTNRNISTKVHKKFLKIHELYYQHI